MGFTGINETVPFQIQLETIEGLTNASQYFLDKTKKHLGDKTIQTLVKEGDFVETILKTAKSMHVDFIVMGSHSQKWLENIFMGSVTQEVLNQTTIPVLIIPTKHRK
ncbi:MAG: universal stress protein [Bacteroidales bacterium]